jgi:hypothetical protein
MEPPMPKLLPKLLIAAALLLAGAPALAQAPLPPVDWKEWAPLMGEWEADAAGPGSGSGGFSLAPELQGRVLLRRNHADYPKTEARPAFRHDDLMVIYRDGAETRADYWDNEGHLIRYVASIDKGKTFTFISDAAPGRPRFRLTYVVTGASALALRFEIAPPNAPEQFKPYIQATVHRKH